MGFCGRYEFRRPRDHQATVWLWVKWLYFYPGDLLLSIIIGTPFGRFFEVSPNNFGGFLSFLLSLPIWVVILAALGRALIFTFDDEYRYDLLARAKEKHKQEQTEDAGKNILFRRQPMVGRNFGCRFLLPNTLYGDCCIL